MAETVIDALLVTLGLDATGFKKGQKEADQSLEKFRKSAESNAKKVGEQSRVMAEGFRVVKNELLGLVGIALGASGIKQFFENQVNGQAALSRSARNLGMQVKELDAFGAAVETVGGTAQGLQQSLQAIQGGFEAFKLGDANNGVVAAFRALGVNITDAQHKIRPMRELLLDVADALKKMPPQDQIRIAQMLGIDEGTLNLLREGRISVEQIVTQMERASGVTEESAAAAIKAQGKWALFKRELSGVGQTIFETLTPALDESNDGLLKFSGWVQAHKGEISSFFNGLALAFGVISHVASDMWDTVTQTIDNINKKLAGTTLGDKIGEWTARLAAFGGSKDANDTLARSGVRGYTMSKGADAASGAAAGNTQSAAVLDGLEKKFGLPQGMMDRIWNIESGRGKNLNSPAGATGPFQFMPGTATEMGLSRADTYDFDKSSKAAAEYLSKLMKRFGGDEAKAVAAYNWGQGNVAGKGLDAAPAETQAYLQKYFSNMPIGAAANSGLAGRGGSNAHVETNIGSLTVQTQATNAQDMARDLPAALSQNSLVPSFSTGMN